MSLSHATVLSMMREGLKLGGDGNPESESPSPPSTPAHYPADGVRIGMCQAMPVTGRVTFGRMGGYVGGEGEGREQTHISSTPRSTFGPPVFKKCF